MEGLQDRVESKFDFNSKKIYHSSDMKQFCLNFVFFPCIQLDTSFFFNTTVILFMLNPFRSSGGVVVELLVCGARGPGFASRSRRYDFRDWLSPASKSRKITKAT